MWPEEEIEQEDSANGRKEPKKTDRKMHNDKQHCFLDNLLYCEGDFIEYWLNNDGCQFISSSSNYFTEYYGFFFPGRVQTNLSMSVYSKCSAISQFHNRKICLLITKMTQGFMKPISA